MLRFIQNDMTKTCLMPLLRKSAVIVAFVAGVICPVCAQSTDILVEESGELVAEKKWLDDYPAHVGFTWGASASVTSNYIWRGLYVGGLSAQVDAAVGYGGFFANLWWNVGATDWAFTGFNPEVDLSIGFSRWGFQFYYLHMYYFDHYADGTRSRYFDMKNHAPGGGGTTGEWRMSYRVSNKLPLSILVAMRTFGRDGYLLEDGTLKRAYSTYIELGYDFDLTHDWTLAARVGMTPAKSMYTGYQGNFAVNLVGLKLQKQWQMQGYAVQAFAHVMLNTWNVNADNLILPVAQAGGQKLNMAVGCSVGI